MQISKISSEVIQTVAAQWLLRVESYTTNELAGLINLVTSVKTLHSIKQQAIELEKPSNWDTICQELYMPPNLDIYKAYYQELITKRVQSLIQKTWVETLQKTKTELSIVLSTNNKNPEDEICYQIWKEHSNDIQSKKTERLQDKKLLLKARGYSQSVLSLCDVLDKCIEQLQEDLHKYLTGETKSTLSYIINKHTGSVINDREEIIRYLQQCSLDHIRKFINFIKTECLNTNSCVILARILQSITQLCPNLIKCFSNDNKNIQCWNQVSNEIKCASLDCWEVWIRSMNQFIKVQIGKIMPKDFGLRLLLKILPQWDTIKIEEKDDLDKTVESKIKIPSQPSLPLQHLLNEISEEFNKILPHTLPKQTHQKLIDLTVAPLVDYYKQLSENEIVKGNQISALQFYLDVKYIQLLMVLRENKILVEHSQNVSETFRSYIDPFDFDVFYLHLQSNIKRSVQKTQFQLGSLVAKPEHLTSVLGSQTSATQGSPGVVALSNSQTNEDGSVIPWFTLLPITAPINPNSSKHVMGNIEKAKIKKAIGSPKHRIADTQKTSVVNNTNKDINSGSGIVRSGAAAFFGAMSQDWFGSN